MTADDALGANAFTRFVSAVIWSARRSNSARVGGGSVIVVPVERHVLDAVRLKEQITQNTHQEWLEEYGRNKRLSSASVPEEIPNLQDWSDSSDEDAEVVAVGV